MPDSSTYLPQAITRFGRTVSAPSWVMPSSVKENCQFLSGKVHEVGLCLFERQNCLDYTDEDLPAIIGTLPVSYHAHFPLDLWDAGTEVAVSSAICMFKRLGWLGVRQCVVHPPHVGSAEQAMEQLRILAERWKASGLDPASILLENIDGRNLVDIWPVIDEAGFSVCLDVGHMLAYGQTQVLEMSHKDGVAALAERLKMLHCHAPSPEGHDSHLGLDQLDENGRQLLLRLLPMLPEDGVIMLEMFKWQRVQDSLPVLEVMLQKVEAAQSAGQEAGI